MHVHPRQRRRAGDGLNSLSAAFETELSHMRDRLHDGGRGEVHMAPSAEELAALAGRFPRFGRLAGLLLSIAEDQP